MELIWNEIAAPRLILLEKPQVLLEGAVPLPAGRDAAELIDYTAEAVLDSCRAETAKLNIDGRLSVRLLAADGGGEVFSFTSESPFSHTLTNAAIEPGMAAGSNRNPVIGSLDSKGISIVCHSSVSMERLRATRASVKPGAPGMDQ